MKYKKFIELRKEGKVVAGIDNSTASNLIGLLPKRYRYADRFWTSIWVLSILGFLFVAVFYEWWVGLLLLFTVTPMIGAGIKKSNAQFALEYAEKNEQFFNFLVEKDLLTFRGKE